MTPLCTIIVIFMLIDVHNEILIAFLPPVGQLAIQPAVIVFNMRKLYYSFLFYFLRQQLYALNRVVSYRRPVLA